MTEPLEPLLRIEDLIRLTACSRTTIYDLIRRGPPDGFRSIHVGRSIRISRAEYDRWLSEQEKAVDAVNAHGLREVKRDSRHHDPPTFRSTG